MHPRNDARILEESDRARRVQKRLQQADPDRWKRLLRRGRVPRTTPEAQQRDKEEAETYTSLDRYISLAGLIYWIDSLERPAGGRETLPVLSFDEAYAAYVDHIDEIVSRMLALYEEVKGKQEAIACEARRAIFQISLNRFASTALDRSVPAVKADAAQALFNVDCSRIGWAVLDSGISEMHPALSDENNRSRVRRTFDFTRIREIVSDDPYDMTNEAIDEVAETAGLRVKDARELLKRIADDARAEMPVNWALVEKLITLKNPAEPRSPHGTHVAGIIGAKSVDTNAGGMCPDIRLYDFRVLGKTIGDTEFSIIAALQFIRYINERHNAITIHGANLSLSIPHNVGNYACGRTPVCNECEKLIDSGVVVVAAAGNRGFQKFQTNDGVFESYAAFSITDPGNADGVITVGSTHGNWPHTYGVSFFSSRGPTGDGRAKPDIVAPGERVNSTVLNKDWAPESGTSMAAPHVSGAAAMLLARYEELIGQPRRVKQILCDTATDLGRERTFQGRGMLDVLRALQSI